MPMVCLTEVLAVLCSTSATASQEQLYDINSFCSGSVVMFLVPMCNAAALCLQSLNERTHERSHPEVTAGRKVILDSRLVTPLEARIILPFPEEHTSRAEEILVRDGVQKQEQVSLDHRSGRHGLVHLLGCGHGRRVLQDVERASTQRLEGTLREHLGQHVVRVGEIRGEEGREWSEPIVHGLAHVAERCLGPFRKGSGCCVH